MHPLYFSWHVSSTIVFFVALDTLVPVLITFCVVPARAEIVFGWDAVVPVVGLALRALVVFVPDVVAVPARGAVRAFVAARAAVGARPAVCVCAGFAALVVLRAVAASELLNAKNTANNDNNKRVLIFSAFLIHFILS
jgi:hypothetical protein